jgi:rhodanese-related sulfurtransferase
LFNAHDLILDCSNDAQTHSLLNEAAVAFQKPLIQVGIWGDEGQIYLYQPGIDGCLRCQWAAFGTAANQNVLNAAGGLLGSMQALEALKLLLGLSTPLSQHVLHFNLLSCQTRLTQKVRNPYCPVCQTYLPKTPPAEVAVTPPHAESSADPDWMVFIDSRNEAQLSSYVLIDVSETREHTTFPGHPCLNMPFSRFNLEAPRLDRSHRYLLYCQKGTRSLHLTRELRRRGYTNVFALAGGIARLQSPQEASTRPLESKAAVELAKPTAG